MNGRCGLAVAFLLWLPVLMAAGCGGGGTVDGDLDGDSDTDLPDPLPFSPAGPGAAPLPDEFGPFPVGVTTITFHDQSRIDKITGLPRRLKTEIWYPARQKHKDGPFDSYNIVEQSQGEDLGDKRETLERVGQEIDLLPTRAVRGAEVDREHGPYPIIFFSHGANGIRWQSIFLTVHLASHGYVVVSPDHELNTLWDIIRDGYDPVSVMRSSGERPKDIAFLLDRMVEYNRDSGSVWSGALDESKVGITGHSFGGFTSVTVACTDPRFRTAVPQAPVISVAKIWGCELEQYPVPIFVMGATEDRTLEYPDQYCDYNLIAAPEKLLYELVGGGHYTFSEMCRLDLVQLAEELDFGDAEDALRDGCSPTDNVPWGEAQETINWYATAWFNLFLRGSDGSRAFLVDQTDPLFDPVNLYPGQAPDRPEWCSDRR